MPPAPQGRVWIHCPDPRRLGVVAALDRALAGAAETGPDAPRLLVTTPPEAPHMALPERIDRTAPPGEARGSVQAFLAQWQPDLLVWLTGNLRGVLLAEAVRQGLPCILAEAATSALSLEARGWRPGARKSALSSFGRALAVDGTAAARLRRAGIPAQAVEVTGPLDDGPAALPCREDDRLEMSRMVGNRPCWLVSGANLRELDLVLAAHRQACKRAHRLLLILAPAKASDTAAFDTRLRASGLQTASREAGEEIGETTEVYLADGPEELGLWYRLAPVTLIGGTLGRGPEAPMRDPLEAAALGSAIIAGTHAGAHETGFRRLDAAGALRWVRTPSDLGYAVESLLAPDRAATLARAGWEASTAGAEATQRLATLIEETLAR